MIVMVVIVTGGGQKGRLISQGQQRIALGAGKAATAVFPGEKRDETAGQQKTAE
jgi:hypothetical protein